MSIEYFTGDDRTRVEKLFGAFGNRIFISDHKYVNVSTYRHWQERYNQFKCLESDIWVGSYSKSGTTWAQEMVWCIANNFDYVTAKKELMMKRFPFFEWDALLPEDLSGIATMKGDDPCAPGEQWKILHTLKEPRTIKTHLHLEILPDSLLTSKSKMIYICRDPKDVCVSYYYHSLKLVDFLGNFDDFFDLFLDDLHLYSPYWKHILDFWNIREKENVLFIRYEELKEDLVAAIKKVGSFLGRNVPEEELLSLVDHLSFNKMKVNPSVNNEAIMNFSDSTSKKIPFMRSGKVGDWKSHMSEDQVNRMKLWTEEKLKDSDFPYYRN